MVGVDAAVALTVEDDALTFGEWQARSDAVARGLVAGTRVGLLFDGRSWIDFAVAWRGVREAGATAVLFSAGAAPADLCRAVTHARLEVLLRPPHIAGPEIERRSSPPETGPPEEIVYLPAPLAPPHAIRFGGGGTGSGPLVHAWAPGSPGSLYALRAMSAGADVATLATFDAGRLCALIEARGAERCGLTPALAAALVCSGAFRHHDISSVGDVVLTGAPSARLRAGLDDAFPGASSTVLASEPLTDHRLPVAVSQEPMLWHEQLSPGSFNLPCLVRRYRGELDVAALQRAFAELARRHQPLRSTFAVARGRAWQIVHGDAVPLAVDDVAGSTPAEQDVRAAAVIADAAQRPFDLATGPLFEPRLLRFTPDDHVLVVRLHHTVFDDWSVDAFRRELSALYTARVAGAPSPLAELPTAFPDACLDRRAALDGGRGAAQLAWWRRELAGAPLAVQLPIAGDGPDAEAGQPLRLDLPPELAAGVRALAPALRATPFMTVLAAFSALLSRETRRDDLLIATVVAHRDTSATEALIGCFSKKVPLRLRVDGDPTFADLVARTRHSLLGALSNQDIAFDAAVQVGLGVPAAEHGVAPQVAVVFQGETPQRVRLSMPGLTIGPYEVRADARRERHFSARPADAWGDGMYTGSFLILSLLESSEGMALIARGVFDRQRARRLMDDLRHLLAELVAAPDRPVVSRRPPAPDRPLDADLRGFRFSPARMERALRRCPGVAGVSVEVRGGRLVADIISGGAPLTMARLRRALWDELPGAPWPAEAVVDGAPLAEGPPEPLAAMLAAMWSETSGRATGVRSSYWQDFSFLQVLAEAREAGIALGDELVARCRTPEMLAAALPPRP